jgi:Cdc6-like AAA superfamily ATPase
VSEVPRLVIDLLNYIEQVEKLKYKPDFTVPTEFFAVHQHELKGLPELRFNIQTEHSDIWLRVPRLRETPPPAPEEGLSPWIILSATPTKTPELKPQIELYKGKERLGSELLKDHPEIAELFRWYLNSKWNPWAAAETPRRKTIKRYNDIFALQQTISTEGADTQLELLWGLGLAVWKKEGFSKSLRHPLITQSCEITLNEKTFDLEVRPRDVDPRIETGPYVEMEVSGVRQLEAFWKSALENGANRPNPFESSTYDGVLKAAVGHLDPGGVFQDLTDDPIPPPPGEKLKITSGWVLYARKRTGGLLLEDLNRLKKSVETAKSLPLVVRNFVQRGDSMVHEQILPTFRGLSTSGGSSTTFELYFPLAYNEEQISIIQKLEHGNGVVVQGPPGTGKTHTIANIICHYLAQGKRVLVTSRGESALNEIIGKLPERIRPLCVGLLSDEAAGMKKFEQAIQTIASNVSAMNVNRANAEVAALQERLNELHAKISHTDLQVSNYAAQHMRNYKFQGQEVTPEEIAKVVLTQADAHQWLDDDLPEESDSHFPFSEKDVNALRQARLKIGKDLAYLNCSVPSPDEFPTWDDLLELHRDLGRSKALESDLVSGSVLHFKDSTFETLEAAKSLAIFVDARSTLKKKLAYPGGQGVERVTKHLEHLLPDDPLLEQLMGICAEIRELEGRRKDLLSKVVVIPSNVDTNEDFREAVQRQARGKSPFSLPFGKSEARKFVAEVTILGSAPTATRDWTIVERFLDWRMDAKKIVAHWNAIAGEFGIEPQSGLLDSACKEITRQQEWIEDVCRLISSYDRKLPGEIARVFGDTLRDRVQCDTEATLQAVTKSLYTHLEKSRLCYGPSAVDELCKRLDVHSGSVVDEVRQFLTARLGNDFEDEVGLRNTWLCLQLELARILSLRPTLNIIETVTRLVEAGGAKNWSSRLRTEAATADYDRLTPLSWREAWNWRRAVIFLKRIDGHERLRQLFTKRKDLTMELARVSERVNAKETLKQIIY